VEVSFRLGRFHGVIRGYRSLGAVLTPEEGAEPSLVPRAVGCDVHDELVRRDAWLALDRAGCGLSRGRHGRRD
jgi:hypothetical protein